MAEVYMQSWKAYWLSTPYAQELNSLVAQVTEDRKDSPISNVVCLSIGSSRLPSEHVLYLSHRHVRYIARYSKAVQEDFLLENFNRHHFQRDIEQFVVVEQIIGELAKANPSVSDNLVAQDILMTPEWRTLFETHGFTVVEDPAAFDLVGPNTLLISIGMDGYFLIADWKDYSGKVGMFFGNGKSLQKGAHHPPLALEYRREYSDLVEVEMGTEHSRAVVKSMFDEELCKHEDVPCYAPHGRNNLPGDFDESMNGLAGLDIWWRPLQ